MSNVHREFLTLDQATTAVGMNMPEHVRYDPNVEPQYFLRRGTRHDGTRYFTLELIERALLELANGTTCYLPLCNPGRPVHIHYTVGRIKFISLHSMVELPVGKRMGQRERIVIPVRCELKDYAA